MFSGTPSEIATTHVVPPPSTPANRLPLTLGTMRSLFMLLVGCSAGIADNPFASDPVELLENIFIPTPQTAEEQDNET